MPPDRDLPLTDYLLAKYLLRAAPLLRRWGDLETRWLAEQLRRIEIRSPIFICGLARSGSTLLLRLLAGADGVATHRYDDFPGIWTPCWWHSFRRRFASRQEPRERPHGDGLLISAHSPEAFEEPIWSYFFPAAHDPSACHVLSPATEHPAFAEFFRDHLRKILLLRNGQRYLSKGNYNATRIGYLSRLFPDARFIIPVRDPRAQVASLCRQQQHFSALARACPRQVAHMRASGHYEFGPQRHFINIDDPAREQAARIDDECAYAQQWAAIYGFLLDAALDNPQLAGRVRLVRHEDLCTDPDTCITELLQFTGLAGLPSPLLAQGDAIGKPVATHPLGPTATRLCAEVAARLGYQL